MNLLFATGFFLYEHFLETRAPIELEKSKLKALEKKGDRGSSFTPDSLFAFDPNETSLEGWKDLGLTEDQARVVINYRKSVGRFFSEEDLLKAYSVRKAHINAWGDSLTFPEKRHSNEEDPEDELDKEDQKEGQERDPIDPFPFDPNQIAKHKWIRLGLSPEQAEVVIRFREAGGGFWKASDLLELYVVDSNLYRKWEPYVKIDRHALKVAIDHADKEELMGLSGIGKKRAGRIDKYRELLGGFHQKEQLREVYGIPDSVLKPLMKRVKVKGGGIDPLPLDTTARHLMQHPYIDPEKAETIVEHRKRYGSFKEKSELRELDLLGTEEYRKIAPYLEMPSHEQ